MKALSVRNLPDDVYEALKKMAAANHRSMQEQVRCQRHGTGVGSSVVIG